MTNCSSDQVGKNSCLIILP